MMKKLRCAEESLAGCLNNERSFSAAVSNITLSADVVEMMGRALFSSDPDYREDDAYLKQAEEMTAAARRIKAFVVKGDYGGAVRAFGSVKKSCDSCHTLFR
jgi:cytochrome c556